MKQRTRFVLNDATALLLILSGVILSAESWFGVVMVAVGCTFFIVNTLELGKPDKEED